MIFYLVPTKEKPSEGPVISVGLGDLKAQADLLSRLIGELPDSDYALMSGLANLVEMIVDEGKKLKKGNP